MPGFRVGDIFQAHLRVVKNAGIKPFVVFDGLPLPAKASEHERRRRDRENILKKADEPGISKEKANKLRSQAASITFEDIVACVNTCLIENVKYIVSPYESDAQISRLISKGHADFSITEDSDLLVYGCKKVMVKVSMSGDGDFFLLAEILDGLNLNMKQFQQMCIAAGCDYLKNWRGVGINKAFQFVSSKFNLLELLSQKGASEEYKKGFCKAEAVFKHQTVFDLVTCSNVPLEEWQTDPSTDVQNFCGIKLDDSFVNDLVVGNVDTKSRKKTNAYPLFLMAAATGKDDPGISSTQSDGDDIECQAFKYDIIRVDRFSSILWKIPKFCVITLEFVSVRFRKGMQICKGVIQKSELANIWPGTFNCTSHCEIEIESEKYTVLWKLVRCNALPMDGDCRSRDDLDCDQPAADTPHCLPFKVLGTCYDAQRQKAFEEALVYLEEYNRPIFAKLEAEPDNPHDVPPF